MFLGRPIGHRGETSSGPYFGYRDLSAPGWSSANPVGRIEFPCRRCPPALKETHFAFRKKYFWVHQVAARGVAKRRTDAFKHFNGERFSVAACNKFYWPARVARALQEFRNKALAMRKNGE
jgi:hypothetical protein